MNDRNALIEAQIPVVNHMIRGFVARNPNFTSVKDDLISTGLVKVIEAVDRFFEENREFDAHFRNYCRISIVTGVSDFVRANSIIPTPKDNWTPCEYLQREPLSDEEPDLTEREVLDRMFSVLQDKTDIKIVNLRLKGRSVKEVSKAVGISATTIYRRLRVIRSRYKKSA